MTDAENEDDTTMSEAAPTVYASQPLELNEKAQWLLVTITAYVMDDYGNPEGTPHRFFIEDTPKVRVWLDAQSDYDTTVSYEPIEHRLPPKGVHVAIRLVGHDSLDMTTACALGYARQMKYGQSADQAFHRVLEDPTCPTCLRQVRSMRPEFVVEDFRLVLKPWSWDNVPESFRPNGPDHHLTLLPRE